VLGKWRPQILTCNNDYLKTFGDACQPIWQATATSGALPAEFVKKKSPKMWPKPFLFQLMQKNTV
jgi:hypothetical protein